MRFERLLVGLGCLALVAAAPAQDSLLGKKKGNGGGNGGGQSSSPPKKSSGGSGGGKSSGSESPRKSNGGGGGQSQGGQSQGSQSQGGSPREYSAPQQPGSQREDNYLQRSQSRSGRPQYRSVHNLTSQDTQRQPVIIKRIPPREDANVPMRDQIRREDRAQIRYRDNRNRDDGYRVGYYHYNSRWRDDSFSYPYYAFDPYNTTGACVVSPWYYYPYLPGYISSTRIVYTTNYGNSFIGFPYDYQPSNRYRDDRYSDDRGGRYDDSYVSRRALDNAIDDIVNAFERQDKRSVDRLVPRSGSVSV
ncbi:MAG: hypothetical protein QOJ65_476, partial [Fimbriimonadaceae bacterium]|nr:hypothetical protein [Fimbriimonadaceae bacterium]